MSQKNKKVLVTSVHVCLNLFSLFVFFCSLFIHRFYLYLLLTRSQFTMRGATLYTERRVARNIFINMAGASLPSLMTLVYFVVHPTIYIYILLYPHLDHTVSHQESIFILFFAWLLNRKSNWFVCLSVCVCIIFSFSIELYTKALYLKIIRKTDDAVVDSSKIIINKMRDGKAATCYIRAPFWLNEIFKRMDRLNDFIDFLI